MRSLAALSALSLLGAVACGEDTLPLDGPFAPGGPYGGDAGRVAGDAGSGTGTGTTSEVFTPGSGSGTGSFTDVSTSGATTVESTGGGSTATTSSSPVTGSSTSVTSTVPTTCGEADGAIGCCVGNVRYYCSGATMNSDNCAASGKVCGWYSTDSNYGCVDAPGGTDPNGAPIACGGGGTSSSSQSTSSSSTQSSSSTSSAPTWTYLYTTYLAEGSTIGDCDGSCHHHSECDSPSDCFNWIADDISRCTWEGGDMPPGGPSASGAPQAVTDFAAWKAAGAKNN